MAFTSRVLRVLTVAGLTLTATLAYATAAVAAPSPTAPATSSKTLSFTPAKGLDTTPMYLVVPAGCPAASTNIVAEAVGHGFPADGQPVIGNTSAGINHKTAFVLPLQDTFDGFAAVNGTALSGPYTISLRCTDSLGVATFATFSAVITFSDAHHFTAPPTPKAIVDEIVASQNPTQDVSPAPSAAAGGSAAPSASAAAGAPRSSATAAPGAVRTTVPSASASKVSSVSEASSTRHTSASTWEPWLVVLALLLIIGAILMRARELRQGRRRHEAKASKAADDSSADLTSVDR